LHPSFNCSLPLIPSFYSDPYISSNLQALSEDNSFHVLNWMADVFCSTWITSSGYLSSSCPEVALVHDLIPERFSTNTQTTFIRKHWLDSASSFLAVSADTSSDLTLLLDKDPSSIAWSHPSVLSCSSFDPTDPDLFSQWEDFVRISKLNSPFVLLPGTGSIGSYKNPEFLASVLSHPSLSSLNLLVTGINASIVCQSLEDSYPLLKGRLFSAGLSDDELHFAYHKALAVVIPSLIEGFGLPVIEAMACRGLVLISDVRGLREAGGPASLRFNPGSPSELINLLAVLLEPGLRDWYLFYLLPKMKSRICSLNPDLLGLSLLAQARLASCV
jgi:glycosyltransferase involved in cell wall biosynthesis